MPSTTARRSRSSVGIDNHPPLRGNERYGVRVPALDDDNNELGVLRMPAVAAPVATYTSWNLRAPAIGQPDALLGLAGGIIPFPNTRADREASGDPAPIGRGALRQLRCVPRRV